MPVKGVNQVKANMKRVFKDISSKKAVQFVTAVVNIGASESKLLTPIAYSTLVNSQIVEVDKVGEVVTGTVSFNTEYAIYLNGTDTYTPLWKPKPLPKYEVKGVRKNKHGVIPDAQAGAPAWNPDAEPRFLDRGFESPQSQSAIKKAIDIFKV